MAREGLRRTGFAGFVVLGLGGFVGGEGGLVRLGPWWVLVLLVASGFFVDLAGVLLDCRFFGDLEGRLVVVSV